MPTNSVSTLNIIDRQTFDNLSDDEKTGNIYFVREGTSQTAKILSLYCGTSRQCDVLDISEYVSLDSIDFNDPDNDYNIPSGYKVSDKLIMIQQEVEDNFGNVTTFYHTYMWNGSKFIDCFGTPNNVIVCSTLPDNPVKDYIYIDLQTKSIYVFDGQVYVNVISNDTYATVQYVQDVYNTLLTIIDSISGGGEIMVANAYVMLNGVTDNVVGIAVEIPTN